MIHWNISYHRLRIRNIALCYDVDRGMCNSASLTESDTIFRQMSAQYGGHHWDGQLIYRQGADQISDHISWSRLIPSGSLCLRDLHPRLPQPLSSFHKANLPIKRTIPRLPTIPTYHVKLGRYRGVDDNAPDCSYPGHRIESKCSARRGSFLGERNSPNNLRLQSQNGIVAMTTNI